MTEQEKLNLMKDRYKRLINNPKNIKAPGTVAKLARKIKKMEQR